MTVHPFYYRLVKYMIRRKVKGDHRTWLTCADRLAYRKEHGVTLSEGHLIRILSENGPPLSGLLQHSLNQLVKGIGHRNWSAFLRSNPLPEGIPPNIRTKKMEKRLEEEVLKCLANRNRGQLALEFE